jgi:hypothetical protein
MKYAILLVGVLASGCLSLEEARCEAQNMPPGGCDPNADTDQPGGYCSTESPECVSGYACFNTTCYPCGHAGEVACGDQDPDPARQALDPLYCLPGEGTPTKDPTHDNAFMCLGGEPSGTSSVECEEGQLPDWYVYYEAQTCVLAPVLALCGSIDEVNAYLATDFANIPHTDPAPTDMGKPELKKVCGITCSDTADENDAIYPPYFNDQQYQACESALLPSCTVFGACT